ncbi:MAG TPA: TlpA disulfide reductase family protein [Burkholderiales bacterium]|jgi:peroxiredoxin|nr:TlpA disulfide reductase family protein [Burkholderiales bacterium]
MRRFFCFLLALPLLFATVLADAADRPSSDVPGSGAPRPVLGQGIAIPEFKTIDGKTVTAADLKGKVVVLEYWASWCPFCQKQLPYFEKLYRARAADGLVVIGLNIENGVAKARGFVESRKLSFPVVMTNPAIDKALQRPRGLPVTYVIGRDGKLARLETGEMFEEDVAEIGELVGPVKK